MLKMFLVVLTLALALAVGPVWAEEVLRKVQKVDLTERTVVLEDGTQLWMAESVSMDILKEGDTIKVAYEEKDGKKVVMQVEVSQ